MLQQRVVNKRAFAPKTRNGCLTCKTRRIKCDESQPRCQPCTRSLRQCHWKRPTQENAPRALIPITPRSSVSSQPPELRLAPTTSLQFQDPRDAQYFQTYQEQVSFELADALRCSPWVEPVLRACHTSPYILQTVVALGALNKSMKMKYFAKQGSETMKPITIGSANSHRAYALSSYAKAISGMRTASAGPSTPTTVRHLLLAGLLVHCMESFLDSPKQAFQHSQAGYKLLLNWIASNPSTAASHRGLASPNTAILEDEIFQEYTRLDADNALYADALSNPQQPHFVTHNTKTLTSMPSIFSTLEEAQSYEELFLQQSSHLISKVYATIRASHVHINNLQTLDFPGHIIDPINLPSIAHLLPTRNEYLTYLTTWLDSFAPFLIQASSSPNPHISVGSAILQGRMIDTFITLTALFTPTTSTDAFLPSHQQIIALILGSIKAATPHVSPILMPVFQSCTSHHHPLNNLFRTCRDAAVRQQIFTLLLMNTPRDGEMDRRRWVHRNLFLAALEEANRLPSDGDGVLGGVVPENYRYHIVSYETQYDEQKKDMMYAVVCGRRIGYREEGIGAWKFRFRTFGEDEWRDLVVGEVVGDDDFEGLRKEREREIEKWPKGMKMPRGLAWELLGWEIRDRGRMMRTGEIPISTSQSPTILKVSAPETI